jgi:hypothetical protein
MKRNKYAAASRAAQESVRRFRACELKRAYPSEQAAFQKGQTTYLCPYCGKWHRSGSFATLVSILRRGQRLSRTSHSMTNT